MKEHRLRLHKQHCLASITAMAFEGGFAAEFQALSKLVVQDEVRVRHGVPAATS